MTIKIYHNPKCSKSRAGLEFLKEKNLQSEVILYLEKGLSEDEIENLLKLLKKDVREIMRKGEDEYKTLDPNLSQKQLIAAIVKNPKLLERPIVINGKKAVIARPTENILEIL